MSSKNRSTDVKTGRQQHFYLETSNNRLIIAVCSWPKPPVNSSVWTQVRLVWWHLPVISRNVVRLIIGSFDIHTANLNSSAEVFLNGYFKLNESFLPKKMSCHLKNKMTHILFNVVGCDWKWPSVYFCDIFNYIWGN